MLMVWETLLGVCTGYIEPSSFRSILNAGAVRCTNVSAPTRGLGSKLPLDMMRTRVETKAIFDLIGQLERGVLV